MIELLLFMALLGVSLGLLPDDPLLGFVTQADWDRLDDGAAVVDL